MMKPPPWKNSSVPHGAPRAGRCSRAGGRPGMSSGVAVAPASPRRPVSRSSAAYSVRVRSIGCGFGGIFRTKRTRADITGSIRRPSAIRLPPVAAPKASPARIPARRQNH